MTTNDASHHGTPAVPRVAHALDDPGTRQALRSTYRKVWLRFAKRAVPCGIVIGLAVTFPDGWVGALGIIAILVLLVTLIALIASLVYARKAKRVLACYPWQPRPGARKYSAAEYMRTGYRIRIQDTDGTWSQDLLARNAVSRSRWPQPLESGLWFAGDLPFGGVIAAPGGADVTFVQPQDWNATAAARSHAGPHRAETARQAGLHRAAV